MTFGPDSTAMSEMHGTSNRLNVTPFESSTMNNYTHSTVIVPWDYSPLSKSALVAANDMVDTPEKIEVVHVTPYPAATEYAMIWGTLDEESICESLEKAFRRELASDDLPNFKFTVEFGDPGTRITEIAEEEKASLIVISSHGHTGLTRLMLGSVAERVVRLAPCPVLVLRGGKEAE